MRGAWGKADVDVVMVSVAWSVGRRTWGMGMVGMNRGGAEEGELGAVGRWRLHDENASVCKRAGGRGGGCEM